MNTVKNNKSLFFKIGGGIAIIVVIGLIVGGIYYIYKKFFKGDGGTTKPTATVQKDKKWTENTPISNKTAAAGYFDLDKVKTAFSDYWINNKWPVGIWDSDKTTNVQGAVHLYRNTNGLTLVDAPGWYAFN